MDEHPIYDTYSAIYRYQGGWAFEDWCETWRPWSQAWEELAGALLVQGWDSHEQRLRRLMKDKLIKFGVTTVT